MKTNFTLLLITGLFIISCESQLLKNNGDDIPTLAGNEFVLITDRIAQHPDVQFPYDTLTESDYIPLQPQKEYSVLFSVDGTEVTISDSISGTRISNGSECSKYDITDGLFAGGRFLAWKNDNRYEAEFTIYGSGVPVIRSERGELRKE